MTRMGIGQKPVEVRLTERQEPLRWRNTDSSPVRSTQRNTGYGNYTGAWEGLMADQATETGQPIQAWRTDVPPPTSTSRTYRTGRS